MKNLSLLLSVMALTLSASFAQAQIEEPIWNCSVTFDIKGGGLKLLIGHYKLDGYGYLSCVDVMGNTEEYPVYVTMGGTPVSLGLGIGHLRLVGVATGIGIAGQPTDVLGSYLVAGARGALVIGGGADLALHATNSALTLNASVQAVSGLGANIGLDYLTIEAL